MLQYATPAGWFPRASADVGALLSDHLHAERKAAESALLLVRRYPHDRALVEALARLAHEETSHVIQVAALMEELGLAPRSDSRNPYARALLAEVRAQEPARRVDLLLVAALIEARSHERLCLLAEGFARASAGGTPTTAARLADFYRVLAHAEERHARLYLELAETVAPAGVVGARLADLAAIEARVIAALPHAPRVH